MVVNTSTTFSGVIQDGGAGATNLAQSGAGTLTLSGANPYTGTTTISAGTLALSGSGSIASSSQVNVSAAAGTFDISGTSSGATVTTLNGVANSHVTLGGQTLTISNGSTTYAGIIQGTGGLTLTGGTQTLSGANTYSGGTTINAAILAVSSDANLGNTSGGLILNGGTLQSTATFTSNRGVTLGAGGGTFNPTSGTLTLGGAITGAGQLIKSGAGTLTLSGVSDYAGGTTINAGTLAVSADGNLGNTSGGLTFGGGTLQYLAGFISNRGVTLNAGGGTFDTNGNDATLAGTITGAGGLTKIGAGALTLSSNSSYSGVTAINAGTLIVNGSIANSAVAVNAGAMLAGTGTVGATTIASGGTFAPGNSPGTMTVAGNLAFQSGALYVVQVNSTTASSANVAGSATLAGTVQAAFAAGSYATRTYTILSAAGGLGGTIFNTLTTSNLPPGFTASLSYTATDAILNLSANLGGGPSAPGGPSALACAFSVNQCNVANALNAFFNNGGALPANFLPIFNLTGANLGNALTLLSGEAATGAQQGAFQLTNQFLGIMLDPFVDGRSGAGGGGAIGFAPAREELPEDIALAYAKILKEPPKPPSFEQRWSVWSAGYGGSNRTSGDVTVVGSHDLSARTAGGAAGLDYR